MRLLALIAALLTSTQAASAASYPPPAAQSTATAVVTAVAAGTTQGMATALSGALTVVTNVMLGAGVKLAGVSQPTQTIVNRGVNTLTVYPNTGASIEAQSGERAATSSGSGISIDAARPGSLPVSAARRRTRWWLPGRRAD